MLPVPGKDCACALGGGVPPVRVAIASGKRPPPADFVALITRANLHRCLDRVGGGSWTDVTGPLPSPGASQSSSWPAVGTRRAVGGPRDDTGTRG